MNKILAGVLTLLGPVLLFSALVFFAHAQSLSQQVIDHRAELKRRLDGIETEIGGWQKLITEKQNEAESFERDIAILDAKISKAKLQIRAFDIEVERLQGRINDKEGTIDEILAKVEREKLSLAEALRKMWEYDDTSVIEAMFAHDSISDYFGDIDTIDVVQRSLQQSFEELYSTKTQEEVARDQYVGQRTEAQELRYVQELERQDLQKNENERQSLLDATRGKESEYTKIKNRRQQDAAAIRSQLFLLQGSPAIPFERAVALAERASQKTGVRVAFALGIIAQESELGKNIGQCNLPEDPPKYKWYNIMKPTRDKEPYLAITSSLGLDPDLMPLSCPLSVGWGGAMGPAQFIPSTWILYVDRIGRATGHVPPNPWEPEDAFMASSLFLSDLGADKRDGEFEAAARYFAGGNWNGSLGRTYANQVLSKVETYQRQIDIISR
ncbi:MAG: lytic murein transglycosylase [bacterium]|nr:lytic murein transglycosylase [bacterium]